MTNKVPFFSYFSNILLFLTQIREKCAMSEVSTKNRIIWETNLINMGILADFSYVILRSFHILFERACHLFRTCTCTYKVVLPSDYALDFER